MGHSFKRNKKPTCNVEFQYTMCLQKAHVNHDTSGKYIVGVPICSGIGATNFFGFFLVLRSYTKGEYEVHVVFFIFNRLVVFHYSKITGAPCYIMCAEWHEQFCSNSLIKVINPSLGS